MLRRVSWLCALLALGCQSNKGGDLSVEQLTAVVAANQDQLKPCYQSALDKQPDSQEFRIQATLHVNKTGEVADVEPERGGLPNVASCVDKVVRTWKFPAAKADTYASMPLIFRPTVEPMFEAPRNPFENDGKQPQAADQKPAEPK
jgi:hypothetical protein